MALLSAVRAQQQTTQSVVVIWQIGITALTRGASFLPSNVSRFMRAHETFNYRRLIVPERTPKNGQSRASPEPLVSLPFEVQGYFPFLRYLTLCHSSLS
jgi:hypothetical protein